MAQLERSSAPVRLAIIGCGAAAEMCHLPAAGLTPEIQIVALVDKNLVRAEALAQRYGVRECLDDFHHLPADVEAAIVALPHFLHAPATLELLANGLGVLVEKPMALNLAEAQAMTQAAVDNAVPLQVGLHYHFGHGPRLVKQAIAEGWLGAVRSFAVEWGYVYDWPATTGFFFSKAQAGGGVLVDFGSHVLDLLLWWLGQPEAVQYQDDARGGVEAECQIGLTLQAPSGPVPGTVALSRLRQLDNTARIVGEHLTIEWSLDSPDRVRLWPNRTIGQEWVFERMPSAGASQTWDALYADQLRAFAHCVTTKTAPLVSGETAKSSLALLEQCYRERQPLELSWRTSATAGSAKC